MRAVIRELPRHSFNTLCWAHSGLIMVFCHSQRITTHQSTDPVWDTASIQASCLSSRDSGGYSLDLGNYLSNLSN